jgi:protein TonB
MFADSMLEVSWAQRSRRSWTTLASFGLQAVMIGTLLILPLWKTVVVPVARAVSTPVFIGRTLPKPVVTQQSGGTPVAPVDSTGIRFVQPGQIPRTIAVTDDGGAPQLPSLNGDFALSIGISGSPDGLRTSLFSGNYHPVMPARPVTTVHPFRTSSVLEGSLVRRVLPTYPYAAKIAHVQGPVVLAATISRAGAIEDLHALSGHPLLVGAAIEAVRQWRYRPYILNSEPIEVETQITVNFTLTGE